MFRNAWQHGWTLLTTASRARKRSARNARWESASEHLEDRALLSATGLAADVAHGKASFEAPQVGGTWDVVYLGEQHLTITLNQTGNKVQTTFSFPNIGDISSTSKFSKKNPFDLHDKIKVDNEVLGKLTVLLDIEFPENANPATFTGQVNASSKHGTEPLEFNLAGTRQGTMSTAAVARTDFPDISGLWSVTLTGGNLPVTAIIDVTQEGKGNKVVLAQTTEQGAPINGIDRPALAPFSLKGKFQGDDDLEIKGKITINTGAKPVTSKFEVTVDNSLESFTGEAHSKKFGDATFTGTNLD